MRKESSTGVIIIDGYAALWYESRLVRRFYFWVLSEKKFFS
jgi:hypothetical protein